MYLTYFIILLYYTIYGGGALYNFPLIKFPLHLKIQGHSFNLLPIELKVNLFLQENCFWILILNLP